TPALLKLPSPLHFGADLVEWCRRSTQAYLSRPVTRYYKVMATINDLVLVHLDRKPAIYALIDDITPDVKRGWYQVELLVLSLPPQTLVWILEETHLQGEEYTMGGRPVQLTLIPLKAPPQPGSPAPAGKAKVISLVRKT
ncbi:MAG: hypothetical protein Q8L43_06245, partial [Deltaproteobacteria bacterium]|nr:hypothetical protein [Deltaproteobacteria bacterium]